MDTKKEILEALEAKHGIVSEACKSIGLARSTYYSWYNSDPEFKAAADEIQNVAIDYVESKLFEKINGVMVEQGESWYKVPPSDTAIIFYLKTKGKKRGYVERQEVDHSGKMGLNLIIEEVPDDRSTDKNDAGLQGEQEGV